MESIDPEKYKKFLEGQDDEDEILNDMLNPIEMKSTRHIELQKQKEETEYTKREVHSAIKEVLDWGETLVKAMIFIIVIFTFFVRVNTVDGESMNPTLEHGQKLLVTDLFYTPAYNDIVIVQAAKLDGGKPIIKRIVGLPGDRVSIDFSKGTVYRNGKALTVEKKEEFLYEDGHKINDFTTNPIDMISGMEYIVPENQYFVLGDNRNRSLDSRSMDPGSINYIGFVDKKYIAGRVVFSIFPVKSFGAVE